MRTKIQVDRLLLIQSLKAELKTVADDFKTAQVKYQKENEGYTERLAVALEKLAARVRKGYMPNNTDRHHLKGEWVTVPQFRDLPAVPDKPSKSNPCDLKRMIKTLELSKQPTISLDEESSYIRFACKL